jgi:predicted component of type VI protein secretion system
LDTSRSHTVAVLGHFSGAQPSRTSRFHPVDRDVLDTVIGEFEPQVALGFDFCEALKLERWRDLHPDAIIERVSSLAHLLLALSAVGDDTRVDEALSRAGVAAPAVDTQADRSASAPGSVHPAPSEGDLLDSMLGDSGAPPASPGPASHDGFDAAIREIVDSSRERRDAGGEARMREAIEAVLAQRLRAILWHPDFRRLEASWTGLRELVRAAPTSEGLRFAAADFSQERLAAEIGAPESALEQLLETELGIPPSRCDLVVTDWAFDAGVDSIRQLAHLGEVAERVGTIVLARAQGSAIAVQDASEAQLTAWNELQRLPGSRRIGLVAPRLLAREPYGAATQPIDAFDFEEGARAERPEEHTWTSGSFALAGAFARAIATTGDPADVLRHVELEDLPMQVEGSGVEAQVCGPVESVLTETLREAHGLMGILPITGVRGTDQARLLGLESLACQPLFPRT